MVLPCEELVDEQIGPMDLFLEVNFQLLSIIGFIQLQF